MKRGDPTLIIPNEHESEIGPGFLFVCFGRPAPFLERIGPMNRETFNVQRSTINGEVS